MVETIETQRTLIAKGRTSLRVVRMEASAKDKKTQLRRSVLPLNQENPAHANAKKECSSLQGEKPQSGPGARGRSEKKKRAGPATRRVRYRDRKPEADITVT